jgi:hypothetical protein
VRSVRSLPETLSRRKLRRALAGATASGPGPLLGFSGSSRPYWQFRGDQPSVALVVPTQGPTLFVRAEDGSCWSRFSSVRDDNWLPVDDARATAALWASQRSQLSGRDLAAALGFPVRYVLVGLSRPRDGHCVKRLLALLPPA